VANLLVINPNSNESVTRGIDEALEPFRASGIAIYCSTLEKAPFGIETDEDVKSVVPLVVTEITGNPGFDAYIIACYSDPGLNEARTVCKKPVLGIQESAVSMAAAQGKHFGVLALGRDSIQRHIAYVRRLGYHSFHAGERPLDLSVDEAANDPGALQKIIETGRELVDKDGAEAIILGCAGMAKHRAAAELEIGVPVIDPTCAAVELAVEVLGG
jgi:Asp/Glu/hydantoin racemase